MNNQGSKIAYFSMEIGLDNKLPTYSGGLGMLAGDTVRSAADLKVPMVAVTLLYRRGYFSQRLDASGWQSEESLTWPVDDFLRFLGNRTSVVMEGRTVHIQAWMYEVHGAGGYIVPVYFLDTDLPENSEYDRRLSDSLYGGDERYRLCQEVVLGIGGVKMLRALGYEHIERFHMNEGHSSLLTLELLRERLSSKGRKTITHKDIEGIRTNCVFTTHTPVPAGHDKFEMELVKQVLGNREEFESMPDVFCCEGKLNMTHLALSLSDYVNGVAKRHGEVSRQMFLGHQIDSITNGVHVATWVSSYMQSLFDKYMPGWREDNFSLRYALNIHYEEVMDAHMQAKRRLIERVNRDSDAGMQEDIFTLGFARRATPYKRADLFFSNIERLKEISDKEGRIQVIYAGKAHPRDVAGKELIKRIFKAAESLEGKIKVAYLNNYDMELGKLMTAGVDVWLNTPQPPLEASGTSGMKAAINGVPSLSVLDGWWAEGCIEGITGWAIGGFSDASGNSHDPKSDADSLYEKLEQKILPLFYRNRKAFIKVMRQTIALNGSFFNTHRMLQEYIYKAYFV